MGRRNRGVRFPDLKTAASRWTRMLDPALHPIQCSKSTKSTSLKAVPPACDLVISTRRTPRNLAALLSDAYITVPVTLTSNANHLEHNASSHSLNDPSPQFSTSTALAAASAVLAQTTGDPDPESKSVLGAVKHSRGEGLATGPLTLSMLLPSLRTAEFVRMNLTSILVHSSRCRGNVRQCVLEISRPRNPLVLLLPVCG